MTASLAVIAGPAFAGPGADAKAAVFSRLDISLGGRISAQCQLAGGGDIDFGELTGHEVASARLVFGCNVPFDLTFQSVRGGLAHSTRPMGEGPFAGVLPYTLNVQVPVLSPAPATLSAAYESRHLTASKRLSSGDAIAAGDAVLQIRTGDPSGAGLLAGVYTETLHVDVTPRL